MASDIQASIEQVRKLAARGDYTGARRRVAELLAGSEGAVEGRLRGELEKQGRTLEVLESVDVVRRLLRDGETTAASQASHSILDALSSDEYARLGVVAAALTLLGRAGELARRVDSGDRSHDTREELDAFVEYLGSELNQLGRDSVDRPLEVALNPAAGLHGAYTLGDLLSRRPWKPNIRPALDAVPEQPSARTAAQSGESPVIGRILIEQEERERVAPAPHTQTSGAGAGQDVFDLVGRAALQSWHVVLFSMLVFAAFGYLAMAASSDRYESSALLQKTPTSSLRAPITGETSEYVPSLPAKTVLELVKLPTFHQRVSKRLSETGWAPGENPKPEELQKHPVSPDTVARALTVTVNETSRDAYLVEFKAVHEDALLAQAIAGASAEEFRRVHYEHVTREATLNLADYEARNKRIEQDLAGLYQKRLEEFATGDVESIGVDIESRTRQLVSEIQQSRADLEDSKIELRAAREELDTQTTIAQRLPEFELPQQNERIAARRGFLEQLERELYELARKRNNFGPDHPIQEKIKELQEDIELVKAEIRELEKGAPEDLDERKLNPVRALAEDRVARARSRMSIAQDRVDYLEKRIPKLETELEGLREDYLASEALRRDEQDLLRAKDRTEIVIEELTVVRASADRELALVSPAADARKIERETLIGIAVGLVLGLVVGIGVAIGLLRRRQLRTARTV
ncbi:MAG: hypothetical protein H6840_11175 [Planctomycetes bacterium]|nr:hypothetical protein [Planctomycetota bacterium]